jgi:hypothetical protein
VQVDCFIVNAVVPWVVRVFRSRITKIDNLVFVIWLSRETALFDTTALVLDENLVIAIIIEFDNAVLCVRDMVIAPHSWTRFAPVTAWRTSWVEDEKVAGVWVWGFNVP